MTEELKVNVKQSLVLGGLMFISWFLATVNIRTVSQANYLATFITDIILALLGFTILKKIIDAKTKLAKWCYALGGSCGTMFGIYISKLFLGE